MSDILLATDEGTHGGPDTVRVYQSLAGGMYAVRYHAGASIGSGGVRESPMGVSTPGYMRWVGPKDVGAAVREARAALAEARDTEDYQRRAWAGIKGALMDAGADVSANFAWSESLTPDAKLDAESAERVKALGTPTFAGHTDYEVRTCDGKRYRVRLAMRREQRDQCVYWVAERIGCVPIARAA